METEKRSPERYFEDLLLSLGKVRRCFEDFNSRITCETVDDPKKADIFVDVFCEDFNSSLEYLLNTLGLLADEYYFLYEYNAVERKILDLELVIQELNNRSALYISRIKNVTTFEPVETLNSWVSAYNKVIHEAEKIRQTFEEISFDDQID